jgi:hypothetical protein
VVEIVSNAIVGTCLDTVMGEEGEANWWTGACLCWGMVCWNFGLYTTGLIF